MASATAAFDAVSDVFVEHAPGEALHLMPGHAYFLVKDDGELRDRLRFEVIPLLDEYLSGVPALPPGQTLLPLNFSPFGRDGRGTRHHVLRREPERVSAQ